MTTKRVPVAGDDVDWPPRTVSSFPPLFHGLPTDATKHGGPAGEDGRVAMRVERRDEGRKGGAVSMEREEIRPEPLVVETGSSGWNPVHCKRTEVVPIPRTVWRRC